MNVLLLAVGVTLLSLPRLLRRLGGDMSPVAWAVWCRHAIVLGVIAVVLGLATTAVPTFLRALGAPALADACERGLVPLSPGGVVGGWLAAGGALWLIVAMLMGWRRARRAQRAGFVDACIGDHDDLDGVELVVLPSPEQLAYSVVGRSAQVVVTSGLVEALGAGELDTVLRHELAHLDRHHQSYITVAVAVETALGPLARSVTGELRLAIERAADEDATAADPRRRTLLRAALLASTSQRSAALATLSPATLVAARIHALSLTPTPASVRTRVLLHAPASVVTATACVVLLLWTGHISHVVRMVAGWTH